MTTTKHSDRTAYEWGEWLAGERTIRAGNGVLSASLEAAWTQACVLWHVSIEERAEFERGWIDAVTSMAGSDSRVRDGLTIVAKYARNAVFQFGNGAVLVRFCWSPNADDLDIMESLGWEWLDDEIWRFGGP